MSVLDKTFMLIPKVLGCDKLNEIDKDLDTAQNNAGIIGKVLIGLARRVTILAAEIMGFIASTLSTVVALGMVLAATVAILPAALISLVTLNANAIKEVAKLAFGGIALTFLFPLATAWSLITFPVHFLFTELNLRHVNDAGALKLGTA